MNHPAVLFHGLANESTGDDERARALADLAAIDRSMDGTRLTGQAAYGFQPADPTSEALDVAGFTFYYGVFYGSDPAADTARALEMAHERYPTKPIIILEFGRWADLPDGPREQVRILRSTAAVAIARSAARPAGYVGGLLWWSLEDYVTMRPRIEVERFGLFAPDGSSRPVADAAAELFGPRLAATPPSPTVPAGRALPPADPGSAARFLSYLLYAGGVTVVILAGALGVLVLRRGRSGINLVGR
jgi:beta-glucuronidase